MQPDCQYIWYQVLCETDPLLCLEKEPHDLLSLRFKLIPKIKRFILGDILNNCYGLSPADWEYSYITSLMEGFN